MAPSRIRTRVRPLAGSSWWSRLFRRARLRALRSIATYDTRVFSNAHLVKKMAHPDIVGY
jgi:hypothetical protein